MLWNQTEATFGCQTKQLCKCNKNYQTVHKGEFIVTEAMKLKDTCSLEEKL